MDFSRGYSCSFRVVKIDAETWRETDEISGVRSISITHSIDSTSPVVDSADLEFDTVLDGESYVRIYMDCDQNGSRRSVTLGTFLLENTGTEGDAFNAWSIAKLWSVLKPAKDRFLPVGWHAPKGASSAGKAAELISQCCDVDVSYDDGSRKLAEYMVAGDEESYLSMAWAILDDGWTIIPGPDGNVRISSGGDPLAVTPAEIIGSIKDEWDLDGIPNTITVTEGSRTVTVTNNDPESPTSTVSRGRIINGEVSGSRKSDETLTMFARRQLREQSVVVHTASYKREYREDILCGNSVTLPGFEGEWRVITQSVECGAGAVVEETVERREATWG